MPFMFLSTRMSQKSLLINSHYYFFKTCSIIRKMRKGFFCIFSFPIIKTPMQSTTKKREEEKLVETAAVLNLRKDRRWQICEVMLATQCA